MFFTDSKKKHVTSDKKIKVALPRCTILQRTETAMTQIHEQHTLSNSSQSNYNDQHSIINISGTYVRVQHETESTL